MSRVVMKSIKSFSFPSLVHTNESLEVPSLKVWFVLVDSCDLYSIYEPAYIHFRSMNELKQSVS